MRQCSFAFNGTIHKRADLFSWINIFPLRECATRSRRINLGLAPHVCACLRASSSPQMFTKYVDPLSSSRHTYARERTPEFIYSNLFMFTRDDTATCTGLDLLYHLAFADVYVCLRTQKGRRCCEYELLGSYEKYLLIIKSFISFSMKWFIYEVAS